MKNRRKMAFHRAVALAALFASNAAIAAHTDADGAYYVYADVVAVTPRYTQLYVNEPVQSCRVEHAPQGNAYGYYGNRRYSGQSYAYDEPDRYPRPAARRQPNAGATIIGGLIGGLIGNQFSSGNGRRALTVAGAALGATIANDVSRQQRSAYYAGSNRYRDSGYEATHCTTVTQTRSEQQLDGYDVTYRYRGQTFSKWVETHPGERIRVRVDVTPVG